MVRAASGAGDEEMKETLTREHPEGLRVVLAEEFPQDWPCVADLIGIDCENLVTPDP